MKLILYALGGIFILAATPALAQDDELDVTMSVIEGENDASEEELVNEIELPLDAAEQAHESAGEGLDTANQARQQGSEFGRQRSEEARENGGRSDNPGNSNNPGQDRRPDTPAP